jgi:hypothetical protein
MRTPLQTRILAVLALSLCAVAPASSVGSDQERLTALYEKHPELAKLKREKTGAVAATLNLDNDGLHVASNGTKVVIPMSELKQFRLMRGSNWAIGELDKDAVKATLAKFIDAEATKQAKESGQSGVAKTGNLESRPIGTPSGSAVSAGGSSGASSDPKAVADTAASQKRSNYTDHPSNPTEPPSPTADAPALAPKGNTSAVDRMKDWGKSLFGGGVAKPVDGKAREVSEINKDL